MSEYEEQYNKADYVAPLSVVRLLMNWAGAVASVALVVGLVYWVFQVGTRNPNDIPIIRAMEGPSRTQPQNPGGEQANHQGLAVNSVQSEGTAEKPAETVVLAPKQKALTGEDMTHKELAKIQPVLRTNESVEKVATEDVITAIVKPEPSVQDPSIEIERMIVEANATVISSSDYAPLKSSIPQLRPSDIRNRIQQATAIAAKQSTDSVTNVPVGTRLVQLGAYDSEKIAKSEWEKLIGKHSDLLSGKKRLVQSAESGGRKFYRLRAIGFENVDDSRNLCSALLARGTPCIPVSAR